MLWSVEEKPWKHVTVAGEESAPTSQTTLHSVLSQSQAGTQIPLNRVRAHKGPWGPKAFQSVSANFQFMTFFCWGGGVWPKK